MSLHHYCILSLVLIAQSSLASSPVSLLADEWCPYTCQPESSKPGILVEISDKIFADSNAPLDFQLVNWARAIKVVRAGKADALLGAYISDSPDFIFHTKPIIYSQMCFFINDADNWQYTGLDSLSDRFVSVINGYSYGEAFDDFIIQSPKNIINLAGDELINRELMMLRKKRINTILEDKYVFNDRLKSNHLKSAGCLKKEGVYIAFSPALKVRSAALADRVDKKLAELESQGEIDKIIERYISKEAEKSVTNQ